MGSDLLAFVPAVDLVDLFQRLLELFIWAAIFPAAALADILPRFMAFPCPDAASPSDRITHYLAAFTRQR